MDKSNFSFLKEHSPIFLQLAQTAEQSFISDPNISLIKLRQLGEAFAQDIASRVGLQFDDRTTQSDLLYSIDRRIKFEPTVRELFHTLRIEGNKATHEFQTTHKNALNGLKVARQLAIWYHRSFSKAGIEFKPGPFVPLKDPSDKAVEIHAKVGQLEAKLHEAHQQLENNQELLTLKAQEAQEFEALAQQMDEERALYEEMALAAEQELEKAKQKFSQQLKQTTPKEIEVVKKAVKYVTTSTHKASKKLKLSEDETRIIIDAQLRERGWEVDTHRLDYRNGARPESGKNRAIAEWPCYNPETNKVTRADYVLFVGLRPVATIEAKKFGNDVMDDLRQAEEYSRDITLQSVKEQALADGEPLYLSTWPVGENSPYQYHLPFVFSTNGREYQRQLATKSGIWFRDVRNVVNKSRPLMGWPTPEEILRDLEAKHQNPDLLKTEPMEYLGLRDYQEVAVTSVEKAILNGQREILVAMATGTGKTRTIIGLMYRLLKSQLFNRILFLVDRNTLGIQAQDAFKDMLLEENKKFAEIYDVKELREQKPESKTKVQVATVQAMVKRIFDADDPIPIRQYDCIVVDEAHRGYILDKEMTEGELELRDFSEYVSSYRRVLDYFDAVRVGMTATPAAHTTEIFGRPVYTYSYREAVIDGWLVDYEPPYTLATRLNQEGIHFDRGDEVDIVNTLGDVRKEELPDELDFEVDNFNKQVLNDNFNRVVCDELAKNYLDPTSREKTLIFCVNDQHADMVVKHMETALDKYHGPQPVNTVMKITGAIRDPQGAIRQYKNELIPNIAVTVDLLTTGVDVLKICNLVFLRRVRSRILYEQMKGRATRRCDEINKDVFRIFDCVRLYEVLKAVDTMKPIVQQVKVSLQQLIDELNNPASYQLAGEDISENGKSQTHADDVHAQLIAKLQRLIRRAHNLEKFPDAAEPLQNINTLLKQMEQPELLALPKALKKWSPEETGQFFKDLPQLLPLLAKLRDALRFEPGEMVISDHEDKVINVGRGYGTDTAGTPLAKPDDYIEAFARFVQENMNKIAALKVVATRPRDLTREDLKQLRLLLAENEFDERRLRTAWKEAKNEDIAASIIGYIRQAALGSPLKPFDERVDHALKKIKAGNTWSPNQERWLDRLAAQLKREVIIDDSLFEAPAFRQQGGRRALEAQFPGEVDKLLDQFSHYMWNETA